MTRYFFCAIFLLFMTSQSRTQADPPPASSSVSDMRLQDLKDYSYAFVSTQTTLNKLQDAIAQLMPKIDAAVDSGALRVMGPYVFTYHGASSDPNKQFTLDIGVIVKDGNAKPDGIQLIKVGPLHCATVVYSGPAAQLPQAYGKLYGEIGRRGLQPTDICREVYLYWEGPNSVNNLIQLQADLSPAN
jgi:effector-binding domain-containing protein